MNIKTFTEEDRGVYNGLSGPESAYSDLLERTDDFAVFLEDFGLLAQEYDLSGTVGAFLLHRHFGLDHTEVIVEQAGVTNAGVPALIAKPRIDCADSVAARWRVSPDGTMTPLEFSSDSGVVAAAHGLAMQHDFVAAFADLIQTFRFTEALGLGLADRNYLHPTSEEWLVEVTTETESILTVESRNNDALESSFIPTLWVPEVMRRCDPWYSCRRACRPHGDAGHGRNHDRIQGGHNRIED